MIQGRPPEGRSVHEGQSVGGHDRAQFSVVLGKDVGKDIVALPRLGFRLTGKAAGPQLWLVWMLQVLLC